MKKMYTKPMMVGEKFIANEYVSACGATGEKVYKFICDAPEGDVFYKSGSSYKELGGYEPCAKTHTVTVEDSSELPFYDGFVDRDGNNTMNDGEAAIIWVEWGYSFFGRYESNWHASEAYTSITDIEVAKS